MVARDSSGFMKSGRKISKIGAKDFKDIIAMRWYTYFVIVLFECIIASTILLAWACCLLFGLGVRIGLTHRHILN